MSTEASDRRGGSTDGPHGPTGGDVDAMIDAEVNEGGPPGPLPCDTPVERRPFPEVLLAMHTTHHIEACPAPDRVVHLPLGTTVRDAASTMLLKSAGLELIRLVIPAGKEIPPHRVPGEITVQCIEGHVRFEHDGRALDLRPGDLLHVCPQEIHAIKGVADSSVLVTRVRPHADELPEHI